MFAIQYAFQFLMIVVDRCGSLWVVPGFSNYAFPLQIQNINAHIPS